MHQGVWWPLSLVCWPGSRKCSETRESEPWKDRAWDWGSVMWPLGDRTWGQKGESADESELSSTFPPAEQHTGSVLPPTGPLTPEMEGRTTWAAGPHFGPQLQRVPASFLSPHPRLLSLKSNLASCIISALGCWNQNRAPREGS